MPLLGYNEKERGDRDYEKMYGNLFIKSGILIAENLIKVKGFEDVVIFINDAKATVIVKSDKLKKEEIAQIQNIIINQLMIDINDISISSREN